MARNAYKPAADQFIGKFVLGTKLDTAAILKAAADLLAGTNGYQRDPIFGPQLAIEDDDDKMINATVYRLNKGGVDAVTPFYIKKEDYGAYVVQSLYEHLMDEASPQTMYDKQANATISTNRKVKALNSVDTEELTAEEKARMDFRLKITSELVAMQKQVATGMGDHLMLATYKQLGIDDAAIKKLIAARPELSPLYATQRRLANI